MIESECCAVENGSVVSRSEGGKTFRIINRSRRSIQVCRVDGCLIDDNALRKCDFLFVLEFGNVQRIILVEMKGTDHVGAIGQIMSSAENLQLQRYGVPIEAFIVGAAAPKVQTKYQNALLRQSERMKQIGMVPPVRRTLVHEIVWP